MTYPNTNTSIFFRNEMIRFVFLALLFPFVFATLGCEPAEEVDEFGNESSALTSDEFEAQAPRCFDRKLSTGSSDFCKPEMFWWAYADQTCFVADRDVARLRLVGKCKDGWYWSAQVTCCAAPTTELTPMRPKRLRSTDSDETDDSDRADTRQQSSNLEDVFGQAAGGPGALPDRLCSVIAGTGPYGICKDAGCKRRGGKCKAKDIDDDGYYDECNCIATKKPTLSISDTDLEDARHADRADDTPHRDKGLDKRAAQEADIGLGKAWLVELWPVPEIDGKERDRSKLFAGRLIRDDADLSDSDLLEIADRICEKNGLLHIAFLERETERGLDFLCASRQHRLATQAH